jgi:hypothetical protein
MKKDKVKKNKGRGYTYFGITFSKYKDGFWRMWGINVPYKSFKVLKNRIKRIYGK